MSPNLQARYWLEKKANRGFRGYPMATVADYGPDDRTASKVVVSILANEDDIIAMEKWFSDADNPDVRYSPALIRQILDFIEQHQAKSVAISGRIIGCPHEEGIDYPEGEKCPQCPFWDNIDRWTGQRL